LVFNLKVNPASSIHQRILWWAKLQCTICSNKHDFKLCLSASAW